MIIPDVIPEIPALDVNPLWDKEYRPSLMRSVAPSIAPSIAPSALFTDIIDDKHLKYMSSYSPASPESTLLGHRH